MNEQHKLLLRVNTFNEQFKKMNEQHKLLLRVNTFNEPLEKRWMNSTNYSYESIGVGIFSHLPIRSWFWESRSNSRTILNQISPSLIN